MKAILKKIGYLLLFVFVVIQFIQPTKNLDPTSGATKNDISTAIVVPEGVQAILKTSCYDCHSNNTVYPWYASIQPGAWFLNDHILEGKKELNFNEFASYSLRRRYKKLEEITKQVEEGEMPLSSYTLIHRDAVLGKAQQDSITIWARDAIQDMAANYPADSLKRKK